MANNPIQSKEIQILPAWKKIYFFRQETYQNKLIYKSLLMKRIINYRQFYQISNITEKMMKNKEI